MNSMHDILSDYKYRFERLAIEIKQKKKQLKGSKISSSVIKGLASDVISSYLPVTKTDSREVLDHYSAQAEDSLLSFRITFNKLFQELEIILDKFVIVDEEGKKEGRGPKSYITSAKNVSKTETKLRHVLNGLDELILKKDRFKEKSKLEIRATTTKKYIKTKAELLWERIKQNNINSIQNLDENEYYDRKEKFSESTANVENLLVALTNTNGGIIVYGIDDNKKLKPLVNRQREPIQNQIVSLCSDKILEPIKPRFHTIITSQDEDLGLLCIYVPRYTKHHHCTSSGRYLWRVGSHNKPIPPGKIK